MDRYRYNPMLDPLAHCTAALPARNVFCQQTSWSLGPRNLHNGPATDRPVSAHGRAWGRYLPDAKVCHRPISCRVLDKETGKGQSRQYVSFDRRARLASESIFFAPKAMSDQIVRLSVLTSLCCAAGRGVLCTVGRVLSDSAPEGGFFCCTVGFLVARGGIEPPTQDFQSSAPPAGPFFFALAEWSGKRAAMSWNIP
jgi:hypothetical protein